MTPRLFVLSGPSGVGKSSLVKSLLAKFPNLHLAVSATTRVPRKGEREGSDYFFVSNEQFDQLIQDDAFIEWAVVHGNRNGTLKSEVEHAFEKQESILFDIDSQGARAIRTHYPADATLIFIAPPSIEELEKRLRARATEDEATIQMRLKNAEDELAAAGEYDEVVINDDFHEALASLELLFSREMR